MAYAQNFSRSGLGGAIQEIGNQIGNVPKFIGYTLSGAGLTVTGVGWVAWNMVDRLFGPEDVLPFMGIGTACLCCAVPLVGGGFVYVSRTTFIRLYNKAHSAVFPEAQPPVPAPVHSREEEDEDGGNPYVEAVNDPLAMLADSLHLLVIGHSGSGKTCLVHAIAQQWVRDGNVVVACDPDAAPGLWRGCAVRGAGDKWEEIEEFLSKLSLEAVYRREERSSKPGIRFQPLYVVLSEYADIVANCPSAKTIVENILRRGRKLDIHLTLDVQDSLVSTLGFEGKNKLRTHFSYIVEVSHDGFDNQRYMTINEHDNPMTTRPRVAVPRLPDLDKLVGGSGSDDGDMNTRMELNIPPVTIQEADPHARVGAVTAPLSPSRNGVLPGTSPAIVGTLPHTETAVSPPDPRENRDDPHLRYVVLELMKNDQPSEKFGGLTVGQVMAIQYALLSTGFMMNQTQLLVFGGKSGNRHAHVTAVKEALDAAYA